MHVGNSVKINKRYSNPVAIIRQRAKALLALDNS